MTDKSASRDEYVKNWITKADNDLTMAKDERYLTIPASNNSAPA